MSSVTVKVFEVGANRGSDKYPFVEGIAVNFFRKVQQTVSVEGRSMYVVDARITHDAAWVRLREERDPVFGEEIQ